MTMHVLEHYSISTNGALLILPDLAIDKFTLIAMILVRTFPKDIWGTADILDDPSIALGAFRAVDARIVENVAVYRGETRHLLRPFVRTGPCHAISTRLNSKFEIAISLAGPLAKTRT
jgi:hypothetical protein